jgi:outer membrane protein OmpA-like peptidoglycan-associated protein
VDVFLFVEESTIEPAPGAVDGPEYLEWVKNAEYFRDFVVAGAGGGAQLAMRLTDKCGLARHAGAAYQLTGPEQFSGVTNTSGELDHNDVLPGDYRLELVREFFADPRQHDPADKIVCTFTSPVLVLPSAEEPQVRMLGAVPRCSLVRLKGLLFDTNKAFVLPSAVEELSKLGEVYRENNPSDLLVVGHTDTTADPWINDPLSLDRARATLAYLKNDVETWLSFYGSRMSDSQRWAAEEDLTMRRALIEHGIPIADDAERKELIAAYMTLDGDGLDSPALEINGTAHGCGENFPLDDSGESLDENPDNEKDDRLDRRVELFFFDTEFGIVPKPRGENSQRASKQYRAWLELAELTFDAEIAAKAELRVWLHDEARQRMGLKPDSSLLVEQLAGAPYRITFPDGTIRIGYADKEGLAVETEVEPFEDFTIQWGRRDATNDDDPPLSEPKADAFFLFRSAGKRPLNADGIVTMLANLGFVQDEEASARLDFEELYGSSEDEAVRDVHGTGRPA